MANSRREPEAALAGGPDGHERLAGLIPSVLRGFARGAAERGGPAPGGGPAAVAAELASAFPGESPLLPARGVGEERALDELGGLLAAGSVDPADPWCAAHLHCPPLAVAVAADVVASALNPSMDSWDQAPVASELEREFTAAMARACFPGESAPDAVITSGGTESNLLGLLLAREKTPGVQAVCGVNSHHSIARAAWVLGLPVPIAVPCADDRIEVTELARTLRRLEVPVVVIATAGTTNTGAIDPLPEIAELCRRFGAQLHVDAAYGGMSLFSPGLAPALSGLELADSVALDMHKFGWQPISAGLLACRDAARLSALNVRAEYLNADDDTEAGLPDLLGRSVRTSRRPDAFRMAVTMRALGHERVGRMVAHCCHVATEVAEEVAAHPELRLWARPSLSTVVFRPSGEHVTDELVAGIRRTLLEAGTAVIGRATLPTGPYGGDQVWLKLTLLHPEAVAEDYRPLLELVAETAEAAARLGSGEERVLS